MNISTHRKKRSSPFIIPMYRLTRIRQAHVRVAKADNGIVKGLYLRTALQPKNPMDNMKKLSKNQYRKPKIHDGGISGCRIPSGSAGTDPQPPHFFAACAIVGLRVLVWRSASARRHLYKTSTRSIVSCKKKEVK